MPRNKTYYMICSKINIGILFMCFFCGYAYAQINKELPVRYGVDEKLGNHIPTELIFTTHTGEKTSLADLMLDDKPIILNMVYYECPMLCGLVLNGLLESMRDLNWNIGEDYIVITLSIDDREDYMLAAEKREIYVEKYDRNASKWHFLTGDESNINQLANAVGFQFEYDEDTDQYAHPGVLMMLSPRGKIVRYIYGIEYPSITVKKALSEASQGKIGTLLDRVILACYQYDPERQGYVGVATRIMEIGGFLIVITVAMALGILWFGKRRQHKITN